MTTEREYLADVQATTKALQRLEALLDKTPADVLPLDNMQRDFVLGLMQAEASAESAPVASGEALLAEANLDEYVAHAWDCPSTHGTGLACDCLYPRIKEVLCAPVASGVSRAGKR